MLDFGGPILPLTINFKIPAYWTPEQALAVFELLDDLRDQIGAHCARTDQDDDQSF